MPPNSSRGRPPSKRGTPSKQPTSSGQPSYLAAPPTSSTTVPDGRGGATVRTRMAEPKLGEFDEQNFANMAWVLLTGLPGSLKEV